MIAREKSVGEIWGLGYGGWERDHANAGQMGEGRRGRERESESERESERWKKTNAKLKVLGTG